MRKALNRMAPDVAPGRVLAGLEKELVEVTDEGIELAARDLGMNVKMPGSPAFIGVLYTPPKRIEDIFDVDEWPRSFLPDGRKDRGDDEK